MVNLVGVTLLVMSGGAGRPEQNPKREEWKEAALLILQSSNHGRLLSTT